MAQILYNAGYRTGEMPSNPDELIDESIRKGFLDSFILVVPTGKLVRKYEIEFVRKFHKITGKPAFRPQIYNLKSFIHLIFSKIFDDYRLISDAYRLAISEEAIENAKLKFFVKKGSKASSTVVKRLANIIYGLREDGIKLENIQDDLKNPDESEDDIFNPSRLADIASIFAEYENLLSDPLIDHPKLLRLLINDIREEIGDPLLETLPSEGLFRTL